MVKLDLDDSIDSIGISSEKHNYFQVSEGPFRLYDAPNDLQMMVTYEMNRDLFIIKRKVYTVLDFLGDIGGLAGALKSLFFVLVIVL